MVTSKIAQSQQEDIGETLGADTISGHRKRAMAELASPRAMSKDLKVSTSDNSGVGYFDA